MARTATIGSAIYEEVNKLVAEGKTRTEAFAAVAKKRKARDGTVAANYYRIARQQGQGRAPNATRGKRAASTRSATERGIYAAQQGRGNGRASNDGDLASLAKQISDLTQELVRRVEERDRRIRELLG
jgi:hypothetical protein